MKILTTAQATCFGNACKIRLNHYISHKFVDRNNNFVIDPDIWLSQLWKSAAGHTANRSRADVDILFMNVMTKLMYTGYSVISICNALCSEIERLDKILQDAELKLVSVKK